MGFLDSLFGKKKEERGEITLWNLEIGDHLEYFMESWEVRDECMYDWGNNDVSAEYTLDKGNKRIFLSVAGDNYSPEINVSTEIKIHDLDDEYQNVKEYIVENGEPPKFIKFRDKKYRFDSEYLGTCYAGKEDEEGSELISWEYLSDDRLNTLTVERWGEYEFEASVGKSVNMFEFSNFVPSK